MHDLEPPLSTSHLVGTVCTVISGRLALTFAVATVNLVDDVAGS